MVASPAMRMAATSGPAELMVFHAVSSSEYSKGHETSPRASMVSPACSINASSLPGQASANVPTAPVGGGRQAITALRVVANSQSSPLPHATIAIDPPGLTTLLASRRALNGSSANWRALNPVTTSNETSAYGNASMSPQRKSP